MDKKRTSLPMKSKQMGSPDFDSMFDPSGLPGLPENKSGEPEFIVNRETDDMLAQIRENRKNHAERFRDVEGSEFWFCVCFQSRSQKEKFLVDMLTNYDAEQLIGSFGDKYISGLELAAVLGIPVEPIIFGVKKNCLAPKSLRGMEVI